MQSNKLYQIGTVIFGLGILGVVIPDLIIFIIKAMPGVFGEMSRHLATRDLAEDLLLVKLSIFFNDYGSLVGVAGALLGSLGQVRAKKAAQPAE